MSPEQQNEILADPEVMMLRAQLEHEGAPVREITTWALNEVTKNMSPGTAIATRLVADCLLQRLREWQEQRKPKTIWGKIIKLFTTGKWG